MQDSSESREGRRRLVVNNGCCCIKQLQLQENSLPYFGELQPAKKQYYISPTIFINQKEIRFYYFKKINSLFRLDNI